MEKPTILIVDDEPNNIKLASQILQSRYKIRIAVNGKEAIERVRIEPIPDLVLLDIMMPNMDGYEVCRQIKSDPLTHEILIIFLTAKTESEDIIKGFEQGAVDYLSKPFNRGELIARINTHLELKLSREKIQQQNKELIEATTLREDIDNIIRHDLKSPLNAILGYPQLLLKRENLSEKGKNYVQRILTSGTRMLSMIELSLNLSKMERGAYEVVTVPVELLALVGEAAVELEDLLKMRQIHLMINVSGRPSSKHDSVLIEGETLLCHTMLVNLIKNAIEASPNEEVITVDIEQKESVTLRIHNKNAVPEEIRQTFFAKYSTSGKSKGTGLGTYSAKLIVETMNGQISMKTSVEEGTVLTIEFPSL